jgi:hypothetical protein
MSETRFGTLLLSWRKTWEYHGSTGIVFAPKKEIEGGIFELLEAISGVTITKSITT